MLSLIKFDPVLVEVLKMRKRKVYIRMNRIKTRDQKSTLEPWSM